MRSLKVIPFVPTKEELMSTKCTVMYRGEIYPASSVATSSKGVLVHLSSENGYEKVVDLVNCKLLYFCEPEPAEGDVVVRTSLNEELQRTTKIFLKDDDAAQHASYGFYKRVGMVRPGDIAMICRLSLIGTELPVINGDNGWSVDWTQDKFQCCAMPPAEPKAFRLIKMDIAYALAQSMDVDDFTNRFAEIVAKNYREEPEDDSQPAIVDAEFSYENGVI